MTLAESVTDEAISDISGHTAPAIEVWPMAAMVSTLRAASADSEAFSSRSVRALRHILNITERIADGILLAGIGARLGDGYRYLLRGLCRLTGILRPAARQKWIHPRKSSGYAQ